MNPRFRIVTDFDGTISINDVGDTMFEKFADEKWDDIVQEWKDGKISSKECFSRGCSLATVTEAELAQFSDEQKIDEHFEDFVMHCRNQNYPITVLSDGLDYYIKRILANNGFADLKIFANELVFTDRNKIKVEFPFYERGCLSCGNCKGLHLREMRNNGQMIVFIGDGYSDRCAVEEADILFAKGDLKSWCVENNHSYIEFENFRDILNKFKEIEKKWVVSKVS